MDNLFICVKKKPIKSIYFDDIIECKNNTIIVKETKNLLNLEKINNFHKFTFHKVYPETSNNIDIFDNMKDYILSKNDFICYTFGISGSGKTHTLFGTRHDKGILLQTLYLLLSNYQNINISCYELYGKNLYDILNNKKELTILESNNKFHIKDLYIETCNESNLVEIYRKIYYGKRMGKSSQNNNSSRSHIIIKINILENNKTILFVDMAGSEIAGISDKKISEIDELAEINKSIFSLKECIRALKSGSKYIPYRGSKLTMILKDSFRDNCDTMIINTITPEEINYNQTMNNLQYINDLMNIKKITKLPEINTPHRRSNSVMENNDNSFYRIYKELMKEEKLFYEKIITANNPKLIEYYKKALLNILHRKEKLLELKKIEL
jgi:kinesin family protein 2/24